MKEIKLEIGNAENEENLINTLSTLNPGEQIKVLSGAGFLILEREASELMIEKADNFPLNGKEIRIFTQLLKRISRQLKQTK